MLLRTLPLVLLFPVLGGAQTAPVISMTSTTRQLVTPGSTLALGVSRTGQYHALRTGEAATEDGFALGP